MFDEELVDLFRGHHEMGGPDAVKQLPFTKVKHGHTQSAQNSLMGIDLTIGEAVNNHKEREKELRELTSSHIWFFAHQSHHGLSSLKFIDFRPVCHPPVCTWLHRM